MGGDAFAGHLGGLFRRMLATAVIPTGHRGGMMVPVPKGPAALAPGNARGVLLADHSAKVFAKCLRKQLLSSFSFQALDTQVGGMPGKSLDLACHLLSSRLAAAKRRGRCAAAIFLDLVAAFYRICVADAARSANLGGAASPWVSLLRRWHDATWWKVRGDDAATTLDDGARP